MQTLNSAEIDYVTASFKAWCAENHKPAPTLEDAAVFFAHVQSREPHLAELMDDDWEDFQAFLFERQLVGA